MKLTNIHDTLTDDGLTAYQMVFCHDDEQVVKTVCGADKEKLARDMCRKVVEAERDIAYRMWGDEWQGHVTFTATGRSMLLAQNMEMAKKLRPDLLADVW